MIRLTFVKAASQVSERTGKPYSRNVRYDEQGTSYFGQLFPNKKIWEDQGLVPPDTLTVDFSA